MISLNKSSISLSLSLAFLLTTCFPLYANTTTQGIMISQTTQQSIPSEDELLTIAIKKAESLEDFDQKIEILQEIAKILHETPQEKYQKQSQEILKNLVVSINNHSYDSFDQNDYSRSQNLQQVVVTYLQLGNQEEAIALAKTIINPLLKADSMNQIVDHLITQENLKLADKILQEVVTILKKIPDGEYAYESNGSCGNDKYRILSSVAYNLAQLAHVDQALMSASEVTGCSSATGEFYENYQQSAFMGILSEVTTVKELQKVWEKSKLIQQNYEAFPVWDYLANQLVELGDIKTALEIADKIQKTPITMPWESYYTTDQASYYGKVSGLQSLVINLTQKGELEAVNTILSQTDIPWLKVYLEDSSLLAQARMSQEKGETENMMKLVDRVILPTIPKPDHMNEGFPLSYRDIENTMLYEITAQLIDLAQFDRVKTMINQLPEGEVKTALKEQLSSAMQPTTAEETPEETPDPYASLGVTETVNKLLADDVENYVRIDLLSRLITESTTQDELEKIEKLINVTMKNSYTEDFYMLQDIYLLFMRQSIILGRGDKMLQWLSQIEDIPTQIRLYTFLAKVQVELKTP